jgi:hypothetical protein
VPAQLATAAPLLLVADRRGAPRVRLTYRVQVRCGAESFSAHSIDVSATGIYLETRQRLPVGSVVHLSFNAASGGTAREPVELEGEVARSVAPAEAVQSRLPPGLGVSFTRFLWGGEAFAADLAARLGEGASHPMLQRRRHRRVAVGIPVYWGHEGTRREAGYLTNLSAAGAFFLEGGATTVPAGASVNLWFEVPVDGEARPVRAVARVLSTTGTAGGGPSGMGIAIETSPLDQATLQAFLDRCRDGVSLEERLEATHPTRLDQLFLDAVADWESNGVAAVGAPAAPTPAAAACPRPAAAAATTLRCSTAPAARAEANWMGALGLGFKLAGVGVAALLGVFVTLLLRLV